MRLIAALIFLMAGRSAVASCPESASPELLKVVVHSKNAGQVEIKPWKKDFCVALIATPESDEKRAFGVALSTAGDASLPTRLKGATGPIPLAVDESIIGLDLAKYDIAKNQTAIGVRIKRYRTYAGGGEATLETLILYLPREGELQPILTTFMSYEASLAGERADDRTRDRAAYDGKATLVFSKKSTQGHFDLIRKTGSGAQHLRWDDGAYVATDDDPFTKDVLDIFADTP